MEKKLFIVLIVICQSLNFLSGQNKPFPQPADYPFGVVPSTVTNTKANSVYNTIKSSYMSDCNGTLRTITDVSANTKVEGVGFGMLLSAYYGDKSTFDRQFGFYKSKRTANAKNLMGWHVTCAGIIDPGNATDGDIDVAFSLIVAYNQWGGSYLKEAKDIINIMKQWLIVSCGDSIRALKPGTGFGGCSLTDIMYYTPAFFRTFYEVTGDTTWNILANDTYRIRDASAHPVTGLVPDWQSVNGTPGGVPASRETRYKYDACRAPWRQALDYLWNGDTLARDWCIKVSNWAYGVGPSNIRDGYNLDGTESNSGYHNSAFVGGFAVGAMCNSQTVIDAFGSEMNVLNESYWFNLYTQGVYLFTLTGNFWKPRTDFPKATAISVNGINGVDSITENRDTLQMMAFITPDTAFDQTVEWSVINGTGKAKIDENGILTPIDNGTVTVRGTAWDGSGVYGEKEILIKNQVEITDIVLSSATGSDTIDLNGGTVHINCQIIPENSCDTTFTLKTDLTVLATITSTGVLTPKNEGVVKVIAVSGMNSSITDTLELTITDYINVLNDYLFNNLVVSPNPVNDIISLQGTEFLSGNMNYAIIDICGSIIKQGSLNNHATISVENLEQGIYFLKLLFEDTSITKRILIQ